MNMISNFVRAAEVVSIVAPFYCRKCKREATSVISTASLAAIDSQLKVQTCASCKSPMEFDDDPDEFFTFLKRGK
jgi:hypothetical protein